MFLLCEHGISLQLLLFKICGDRDTIQSNILVLSNEDIIKWDGQPLLVNIWYYHWKIFKAIVRQDINYGNTLRQSKNIDHEVHYDMTINSQQITTKILLLSSIAKIFWQVITKPRKSDVRMVISILLLIQNIEVVSPNKKNESILLAQDP